MDEINRERFFSILWMEFGFFDDIISNYYEGDITEPFKLNGIYNTLVDICAVDEIATYIRYKINNVQYLESSNGKRKLYLIHVFGRDEECFILSIESFFNENISDVISMMFSHDEDSYISDIDTIETVLLAECPAYFWVKEKDINDNHAYKFWKIK